MWKGVAAMMKNDGSELNKDVFWRVFFGLLGENSYNDIPIFDEFYTKGFHNAKAFTQPNGLAKELVMTARKKAGKVILATNPFFPRVAVKARLEWCGLSESDFDYITEYENSSFCKPNPDYFCQIAEKLGVDPKNCLMIGNNAQEDAEASMAAGMTAYLVTDCLINEKESMPDCMTGTLAECVRYLKSL
jgi:HAD superfamily hydrolase (TIGR01549 family)